MGREPTLTNCAPSLTHARTHASVSGREALGIWGLGLATVTLLGGSRTPSCIHRDLLKLFTTMELMRWSTLVEDYGVELRKGSSETPATDVFSSTEEGEKRWKDLKSRVVEHVSTRQPAGSRRTSQTAS